MAVIDIGSGATDRAAVAPPGSTLLDLINPANDTGTITSFEIYAQSVLGGCKIGTFSGSGTSWDDRDYENIGTINAGSKQTFSGLNCSVSVNDIIGSYWNPGNLERDDAGGFSCYISGDMFGTGVNTYTAGSRIYSLYGTGTTGVGWTHISKVLGVGSASIAKINGVAVASIAKINGVAV